jgi:hypothetical protein
MYSGKCVNFADGMEHPLASAKNVPSLSCFVSGDASLAFAYIFAILNTLQGLWIFIFYCLLKKDVQHAWMRKLICCPTPEDSRSSKGKRRRLKGHCTSSTAGFLAL